MVSDSIVNILTTIFAYFVFFYNMAYGLMLLIKALF
jgi:hypothetical protein